MRDGRACTGRRACAVARVRGGWVRVRGGARDGHARGVARVGWRACRKGGCLKICALRTVRKRPRRSKMTQYEK